MDDDNLVFIERAPHEKGFAEHFEQYVKPILLEIEKTRLLVRRNVFVRATLASLGVIALIIAVVTSGFQGWIIFVSAIIGGYILTWAFKPGKEYKFSKKQIIIPEILKFFGVFTYHTNGHIPSNILTSSRLFKSFDEFKGEDKITGKYFDQTFQFVEAELIEKGGEDDMTVFRGFIFVVELSWKSEQQTVAISREHRFWKYQGSRFKDLQEVEFDNRAFQERFTVYSSLPDEARRTISPSLIEFILRIGRLMQSNDNKLFIGDQLFVLALATNRDLFDDVSVFNTALTVADSRRFLEEIHEILEIVATLANITAPDDSTPETDQLNRVT